MLEVQDERLATLERDVEEATRMCNLGQIMRMRHQVSKLMHHHEIPEEKGQELLERLPAFRLRRMTYEKRNQLEIATLDPAMVHKVLQLFERLVLVGEDILITSAFRSEAEQADLYAQGRTKFGKIVTDAPAGWSFHNYGVAIDIAPVALFLPLEERGALAWYSIPRFENVAREAKEIGLTWGYAEWGFDRPHFHYTQGLTIEDFRNGKRLDLEQAKAERRTGLEERLEIQKRALERDAVSWLRKKRLQRTIPVLERTLERLQ